MGSSTRRASSMRSTLQSKSSPLATEAERRRAGHCCLAIGSLSRTSMRSTIASSSGVQVTMVDFRATLTRCACTPLHPRRPDHHLHLAAARRSSRKTAAARTTARCCAKRAPRFTTTTCKPRGALEKISNNFARQALHRHLHLHRQARHRRLAHRRRLARHRRPRRVQRARNVCAQAWLAKVRRARAALSRIAMPLKLQGATLAVTEGGLHSAKASAVQETS